LLLLAVVTLGSGFGLCQANAGASVPVLHDGCPIRFTLARTVSSESDQPGELVEFTVRQEVTAGELVIVPEGTSVYGKVVASRLDDRATGKPGMVEFRLESLKLGNGQIIPLRNIEHLPTDANADLTPESLTNLVNSPYAPFGHFKNGPTTTIPKNTPITLYVAADVAVGAQPGVAPLQMGPSESLATHILHASTGGKSLAEIAREQREKGKISGGMVSASQ
jgi:hypothetical protein